MIIQSAIYFISAVDSAQYPQHEGIEFVFLGRSMSESSLINAICNRKIGYTSSIRENCSVKLLPYQQSLYVCRCSRYGFAKRILEERIKFGK